MIEYTGSLKFGSEVAGSASFLGSNAPVFTANTSLEDLFKLQDLYSSKKSTSIFNPAGRTYSNLNKKLQAQLDKKDPVRAKRNYLSKMQGYGIDFYKLKGIYEAAPAEYFTEGQGDALSAFVDEQQKILMPKKQPPKSITDTSIFTGGRPILGGPPVKLEEIKLKDSKYYKGFIESDAYKNMDLVGGHLMGYTTVGGISYVTTNTAQTSAFEKYLRSIGVEIGPSTNPVTLKPKEPLPIKKKLLLKM